MIMSNKEILDSIRGKLIVSCQANEDDNPFNSPEGMVLMAKAACAGGCGGFRANYPENVRAIKESYPDMPMMGIWKVATEGFDVYITPTMREVETLREIGSEIIAIDGTDRLNCNHQKAYDFIREVKEKYPDQLIMADIATINDARLSVAAGADIISTTMSGYTEESLDRYPLGPDYDLIRQIRKEFPNVFINAEGRISTKEETKKAFECGADTVVIGTAITNPMLVTRKITEYIK